MKPWHQRDPARYEAERGCWGRLGFTEGLDHGLVTFTGSLKVRGGGRGVPQHGDFELRVTYPAGFPYRPPEVEFLNPAIRGSRHQSPSGAPCLFEPRAWTQHATATQFTAKLRSWLMAHLTGSFARELALYELPDYFDYSPLTVLAGDQTMQRFRHAARGRFSVLVTPGRQLAVLKTIDKKEASPEVVEALFTEPGVEHKRRNGRWFRLKRQPPALRDTRELATLLRREGHDFVDHRKPTAHGLIGLIFTDEVLDEERLLLLDFAAPRDSRPKATGGWPLRAPWVGLTAHEDLFKRLQGVRDREQSRELRQANALMLGAGAIGSTTALALAREGIGGFIVADHDTLRPGNVMRHACDLSNVGQSKAAAVAQSIKQVNPDAQAWTITSDLTDPQRLSELFAGDDFEEPPKPDLVISAIGDDVPETLVCEVAAQHDVPVLFVRTLHNGDLFRLALFRPGRGDACIDCMALHAEDEHPGFIQPPEEPLPSVYDAGCATAAEPGAGLASQTAGVFAAKRALRLLVDETVPDTNQWVWVDRALPAATDVRLHWADTMHGTQLPTHPECLVCT